MRKINIDRIGETSRNTYGSIMTIIEYNNSKDITVEFENGYRVKSIYGVFQKGGVKSPYDKSVCGVGYLGEGEYKCKTNKRQIIQYDYWRSMLHRCYDQKFLAKHKTYENKYVCEDWHNFQNFAKWFDENYYEIDGDKMCLDKDILFKENKIYSPETCIFVPQRINILFTKCDAKRGEYPIGVTYHKPTKKFIAYCSVYDGEIKRKRRIHLGCYNNPESSFQSYKEFKERYIKQIADEYKDKIPQKLYEAMYKYEVDIND